jgi:hypothetical protein
MNIHISIADTSENDPDEREFYSLQQARTHIADTLASFQGKYVFIIGDEGSYFDDRPFPVNRIFIHESADDVIAFFNMIAVNAMPRLRDGKYMKHFFLFMQKDYVQAYGLAADIIDQTTSTELREM